ncbi:MAG: ribosome biogenesis GTPase Der [Bifidobacteriaceae bacterium]|jgi:GTP-binding protein|nr:ribosome biogenesis GTPase Der [Bifidobacteriaceae bacterium]
MQSAKSTVIAIDGGAGVGKSSTSKKVASILNATYLDTGAIYRAFTLFCLLNHVNVDSETEVTAQLDAFLRDVYISINPDETALMIADNDITQEVRSEVVSLHVSKISAYPSVRERLIKMQQDIIAEQEKIVVEGRDIAKVVAPHAVLKVLLTASEKAKAERRGLELHADTVSTQKQLEERDKADLKVNDFDAPDADVEVVDNTNLSIDETVDVIVDLFWQKMSENDSILTDFEPVLDVKAMHLPRVAVIGRANVGKSTFINRIIGSRAAIVEDTPGVTRDRVEYLASWNGKDFELVDTGGLELQGDILQNYITEQAKRAIDESDVIIFLVDAAITASSVDSDIVKYIRRSKKPHILVANKADDSVLELSAASFWQLGLGEPYPISALHGIGIGDVLDEIMKIMPAEGSGRDANMEYRKVALVGRPNVGKSSLLNKFSKKERSIVSEQAGTTRDPVDELIIHDGVNWLFVDTAGIKRKFTKDSGADYYSAIRANIAIQNAEVVVIIIDASQEIAEQDIRLINETISFGRAIVIALNKWDLMDDDRREYINRILDQDLSHTPWIPILRISALTGKNAEKLFQHMREALKSWDMRISTGRLNAFLSDLQAAHPHPIRGGKQPRILYATQGSIRPPHFVLFSTGFLERNYRKYIERKLRETFGFDGSPVKISVRVREKRRRK